MKIYLINHTDSPVKIKKDPETGVMTVEVGEISAIETGVFRLEEGEKVISSKAPENVISQRDIDEINRRLADSLDLNRGPLS